ncbi:MAG TPA: c-type cytochrome biogenesis protein CcmI [Paracoccaceae bacterium]|nr:c-type cytochrome biogenesis protein CcmI [Paracoccaceae bacterium]
MLFFYIVIGGTAALVALALVRPLIAGRRVAENRDQQNARLFRDQLAEIERDLARGTISASEAEGARIEISRRLLAADQKAGKSRTPAPAPRGRSRVVAVLALIATPVLAMLTYVSVGAPGMPDHPLAERSEVLAPASGEHSRPDQATAEAAMADRIRRPEAPDPRYVAMVAELEDIVSDRPDDLRGHQLLANALMNLGRYAEAWRAYAHVIELAGGAADAKTHAAMAEGMILAAGGYVSPAAEEALSHAVAEDPELPIARYYNALALHQAGRADEAIAIWEALREDSPSDAPYLPWLDRMLANARGEAADPPTAPPNALPDAPGPGAGEIAAAEQLSPEERMAMIEGMVSQLETRLIDQGGSVEEWVRLIDSYMKLDRPGDAARIYAEGREAFKGQTEAGFLREQAMLMGVQVE